MATYHFSMKTGKAGTGGAHADYISRENAYADKPDLETSWSCNLPSWAADSSAFFAAADEHERANGRPYREFEIALPRELTPDQREALVEEFCKTTLGDKHAYQVAIHNPKAAIDCGDQPHAHVMFSERRITDTPPEVYFSRKGGGKDRDWTAKDKLVELRESWASHVNRAYEKAGHDLSVDHRSLKDQGIDRAPEPHLGPHLAAGPAGDFVAELRVDRERVAELDREINHVDFQIADVQRAADLFAPAPEPAPVLNPEPPAPEPAPAPVVDLVQHRETMRERISREAREYAERKEQPVPQPEPTRLDELTAEISRRFATGEADADKAGTLKLIDEKLRIEDPQRWARQQIDRLQRDYNISKSRPDTESERMKRAEIRGEARELCKTYSIEKPDMLLTKAERSRGIKMDH